MLGFVIGDRNMVMGFRLVGMAGKQVDSADSAKIALEEVLTNNEAAVVLVGQQFSDMLRAFIDNFRSEHVSPIIIEIPGSFGPQKEIRLSELVNKTIGVKL